MQRVCVEMIIRVCDKYDIQQSAEPDEYAEFSGYYMHFQDNGCLK